ncbi:hypothetical protein D3C81_1877110 [compost metagenome]
MRNPHAIHLGQHAVAVDAADVGTRQTEAIAGTTDRNTRLVAHQILEVLVVVLIDFTFVVHRHRAGHLQQGLLGTRRGHADGIELGNGLGSQGQRWREQQQGKPGTLGKWRADRHLT